VAATVQESVLIVYINHGRPARNANTKKQILDYFKKQFLTRKSSGGHQAKRRRKEEKKI
jgi:hypothetical protein